MGLFARYRRPWIVIIVALLALPMLVQAMSETKSVSQEEARKLSPAPAWPKSLPEWRAWPRDADLYVADHFGLREELVHAQGVIRFALAALPIESPVIIGHDRQLFLNQDKMIEQSAGRLMRTAAIAAFDEHAARLQARLRAANAQFLVAIPPNSSTVLRALLPAWAADQPVITEYDAVMAALAERKIAAVDLRPALSAANSTAPLYRRTDTHWNRLGALIAYNAVVNALGRPEWTIDPRRVFHRFETVPSGDLARLLAVSAFVSDEDAVIDLSAYAPAPLKVSRIDTRLDRLGELNEIGRAGPAVLVIGDSFTRTAWRDYFLLHAARYLWISHDHCSFAPDMIERYRPDIVILAPAERFMFCHDD